MCGLVNHALLEHLVQDQLLALFDLFRVVIHVINRRVVGQSGEHRALRQRQLGHVFAEISFGCGLYAVAAVAEVDCIEVHGQDAVFIVDHILQCKRAEDLVELALDRIVVILGRIFDQLLGDGRAAILLTAEQPVFHRAQRALPVHAAVRVKTLVLDRDHRVFQVLRDLVAVHPFAALVAAQGFINHIFACVWILCIDKAVEVQAQVAVEFICRFLCGGIDIGVDIIRKRNAAETGAKHTDKQQRQQDTGDKMPSAGSLFFASCQFGFLLARRQPRRGVLSHQTKAASDMFPTHGGIIPHSPANSKQILHWSANSLQFFRAYSGQIH